MKPHTEQHTFVEGDRIQVHSYSENWDGTHGVVERVFTRNIQIRATEGPQMGSYLFAPPDRLALRGGETR